MLSSLDALEKAFLDAKEKSKKECGEELEVLRKLIFDIKPLVSIFVRAFPEPSKQFDSLVFWNWLNFIRNCGYTLFLASIALYRNAYDCIRHILESIVQALYLDSRHPNTTIETKIHILSEVEDKRDYRVGNLIHDLDITDKEKIIAIYKSLSRKIHPTIQTVKSIFEDFLSKDGLPTIINCDDIVNICVFLRDVIDVFFFLNISYFPEHKEKFEKNKQFTEYLEKYKPYLTSKTLKIKITTR